MTYNHKFSRFDFQAKSYQSPAFGYAAPYIYPVSELASYCHVERYNLNYVREQFRIALDRGFTPANDTPSTYYGFNESDKTFVNHWHRLNQGVKRKRKADDLDKELGIGEKSFKRVAKYHPDVLVGCSFAVSERDVKFKVFNKTQTAKPRGGAKRGKVTEFSDSSRERLASHLINLPSNSIKSFLTLTYPDSFPVDGEDCKYHLKKMRQWFRNRGINGVWFLEFQKRGAPHFHAFLSGYVSSFQVTEQWIRCLNYLTDEQKDKVRAVHNGEARGFNSDKNRPCIELLRCSEAMQKYATKYAYKCEQKTVPSDFLNVGRFWGSWGKLRPRWQYYSVFGDKANAAGLTLIQLFKDEMFSGFLSDHAIMSRSYSTTLRGGADIIKILVNKLFDFDLEFRLVDQINHSEKGLFKTVNSADFDLHSDNIFDSIIFNGALIPVSV